MARAQDIPCLMGALVLNLLISSLVFPLSATPLKRRKSLNTIKYLNHKGPYLGLITVYPPEEKAFFATKAFKLDPIHPFVDLSGRRFRVGKLHGKKVIYVRCGVGMDTPSARKRHLHGVQHQRSKALWYNNNTLRDANQQFHSDSFGSGLCNRFLRTDSYIAERWQITAEVVKSILLPKNRRENNKQVASSGKKYGGLVPKKKPLISKDHEHAFFDSTDWALCKGLLISSYADFDAAIEDLYACVKLDKDNKSAYTYLGLALSSIGEYRRAKEAHMK